MTSSTVCGFKERKYYFSNVISQNNLDISVLMEYNIKAVYTQGYRSGHNEAVLKTVWGNPREFESHTLREKESYSFRNDSLFMYGD